MKSDQEFLAGIWNHIVNLEVEEREKATARRRNRALQIRRIAVLGGMLCAFLLLAALFPFLDGRSLMNAMNSWGIYVLAGFLLLGGYVAESRETLPRATHQRKGLHR
jgi:uncharacterized membrane protein